MESTLWMTILIIREILYNFFNVWNGENVWKRTSVENCSRTAPSWPPIDEFFKIWYVLLMRIFAVRNRSKAGTFLQDFSNSSFLHSHHFTLLSFLSWNRFPHSCLNNAEFPYKTTNNSTNSSYSYVILNGKYLHTYICVKHTLINLGKIYNIKTKVFRIGCNHLMRL